MEFFFGVVRSGHDSLRLRPPLDIRILRQTDRISSSAAAACFRHASMQWRRTLQKRLSTSLIAVRIASHHHEWSNRDGLGFRRLKCEIHRAIADGTGTMAEPTRNCHHLAWTKLQRSTLELDTETPFDHEECLIGIRVEVPVVRLCHHADPDDMIIDRGNRMIVVASLGRAL